MPSLILSKKTSNQICWFFISLILFYNGSCTYFRVDHQPAQHLVNIENIGTIHKRFIVHTSENKVFEMENLSVDTLNVYGTLKEPTNPIYYATGRPKQYSKYQKDILNEVHLFLKTTDINTTSTQIPLSEIKELRIIEQNTGKTIISYVFGTVLVIFGTFIVLLLVIAAFKSSCPYIYSDDGEGFVFEGETFGGAIGRNIQRDDFLPLPQLRPHENQLRIRISNELKERQYMDLARMIVIEHDENESVLLDINGSPHIISEPISASAVSDYSGADLSLAMKEKDEQYFLFNDETHSTNGIISRFKKPENKTSANIIFKGKNTLFFDYIFGEFTEKFGASFNNWMNKQSAIPTAERTQNIIDQQFPLSVYVKKNGEWQLVERIFTVGPLASREFCVPIDLNGITTDEVEVKLETGFMFWEMDYLAIDFTDNHDLNMQELKPAEAMGTGNKDWKHSLSEPDLNYMAQEITGEYTDVVFSAPAISPGKKQSYFLHSNGYYELIREYEGAPQIGELLSFKTPGHFSDYTRTRYQQALNRTTQLASN